MLADRTLHFELVLMKPLFKTVLVEHVLAFVDLLDFDLVACSKLIVKRLHTNTAHVVFGLLLFVEVFVEVNVCGLLLQQQFDVLVCHFRINLLLIANPIVCVVLHNLSV